MPRFKVAAFREQGQNMLIFPLDSGIHHKTNREKSEVLSELEARANAAGLPGSGVIVWEYSRSFHFMGPQPWHPFLRSLNMSFVLANVNQELHW